MGHGVTVSKNSIIELLSSHEHKYVCRGAVGSDFTQATLTHDSAYHELDLSAIVPKGAVAVNLYIFAKDGLTNKNVYVGYNGANNVTSGVRAITNVANTYITANGIVGLDSDRKVEYYIDTGVDSSNITVLGWFI